MQIRVPLIDDPTRSFLPWPRRPFASPQQLDRALAGYFATVPASRVSSSARYWHWLAGRLAYLGYLVNLEAVRRRATAHWPSYHLLLDLP